MSTRKLTYDDFLLFPDDGQRHELIDGEHHVTPSPNLWHQELSKRLTVELEIHLRAHGGGRLFYAPLDCVFTLFDIVEPDLLLVTEDQDHILTEKNVRGAPALVVEILSRGTRRVDEKTKRDLYDRVGVREYWIIDPTRRQIRICARRYTVFEEGRALTSDRGDTLTTELLPGFSVRLADYFR